MSAVLGNDLHMLFDFRHDYFLLIPFPEETIERWRSSHKEEEAK
jgi:hypothetical protein